VNITGRSSGTFTVDYSPVFSTDTSGSWAMRDSGSVIQGPFIQTVLTRGIMQAPNGQFSPTRAVTRAEFAEMLARAAGVNVSGRTTNRFTDVSASTPLFNYIAWCVDVGIINGFEEANGTFTFRPNGLVTREQMATMICRFVDNVLNIQLATNHSVPLADIAAINAASHLAHVQRLVSSGIIEGNISASFPGQRIFNPRGNTTNEQMAKILTLLVEQMMR
jgi:hypothetical protein